ncbi:MAG TPA: hypothetical protein VML75_23575 [Kofleriaceae bacterium]|nr:hypothetical protein [Kofleriaceae bacterium]
MSLAAICPSCHTENAVSNVACDICRANLGATIVETKGTWRARWMGWSALVTAGLVFIAYVIEVPAGYLALAAFYGPLICSRVCKTNVIWETSLGAMLGIYSFLLLLLLMKTDGARDLAGFLVTLDRDEMVDLLLAFLFTAPVVYPFCLIGATAGDRLGQRAGKTTRQPVSPL